MSELKFEVGKKYKTRDGGIFFLSVIDNMNLYGVASEDNCIRTYELDGAFKAAHINNRLDLVAEIKDDTEHLQEVIAKLTGQINKLNTTNEILERNNIDKNNLLDSYSKLTKELYEKIENAKEQLGLYKGGYEHYEEKYKEYMGRLANAMTTIKNQEITIKVISGIIGGK